MELFSIRIRRTFQLVSTVDWVNSTKTEQTKADRITKIIIMAMNGVIGYI